MKAPTLASTLKLIHSGDDQGFTQLYQHHYRLIFGAAYSILQNEEESKEIAQIVIIKLHQLDKSKYPQQGEISWLYTLTRNEALMRLRKEKRKENLDTWGELPVPNKELDDFCDRESFYAKLEGLSTQQKEIVSLKLLTGLNHREIAQQLHLPMGTVQSIYHHSIKKLRLIMTSMASILLICVGIIVWRIQELQRELLNMPAAQPMIAPRAQTRSIEPMSIDIEVGPTSPPMAESVNYLDPILLSAAALGVMVILSAAVVLMRERRWKN